MALDDTNSYVSLAEFNAFLATRAGAEGLFDTATDAEKEKWLITAFRRLEQETWLSHKTDDDQPREWPRAYVVDKSGFAIEIDEIPAEVGLAQMELAIEMKRNPTGLFDTGLEVFESLSKGDISLTPRDQRSGRLPANVVRYIAQWLVGDGLRKVRA